MRLNAPIINCVSFLFLTLSSLSAESIWIEGEDAASHDFVRHGWYDDVNKEGLSGDEWLSHYSQRRPGVARYVFEVNEGGKYVFWLRCNYFKSEMAYRLDGGEWTPINLDDSDPQRVRDKLMVSTKPDHRFIGWVRVGSLSLEPGKHELELRISSGLANHGAIDCLCLSDGSFVPSGATKPQAERLRRPDEWFPVVTDRDPFGEDSRIDLSDRLHKPAGKYGALQRDGDSLKFARRGGSVKFWGVNAPVRDELPRSAQTVRARYLAKHGVNMVRQHSVFGFLGPRRDGGFDAEKLDAYDWWFAELKKHGIYVTWSVFYPLVISADDGYPQRLFNELENGKTYGLVNISRELQDLQIDYVRALLNHRNPYTGKRYRDDAALAVVETHNEDCIFFHNPLNTLHEGKKWPEHSKLFRRMFRDWARERYETDVALQEAWGTDDSFAQGEFAVYGAWQLDGKKLDARKGDFVRFLTELQRGFYERRETELRRAGFRGVTVSTAWRAGGAGADAANLYCDTAMDMIDRHNYFGGGAGRHRIVTGEVSTRTHLGRAGSGILASGLYQVEDRPFAMTEWTQSPPNPWKAECAPLVAFYGMGLQDWDASYHFSSAQGRLGDGWPNLSYYVSDTPHYMGQFPALALAVRRGDVKAAPLVAARRVEVDNLFRGVDVLGQNLTGGTHDKKSLVGQPVTPPEMLAVGRVTVSFQGGEPYRAETSEYVDRDRGIVRSMTGELVWDTKQRVVTLGAPRTHAIIGFAGGRTHELPQVEVDVDTPFVSLIFTSLDDRPLEQSQSILITAMARDRQTGTRYAEDFSRLEEIGGPPLLMEPVQATIRFEGEAPRRVEALDFYGEPKGQEVPLDDGAIRIDGTYATYYYHVAR